MKEKPFFSIIMPAYNSEKTIGIALKSVRRQNIDDTDVEILVIDGGSTDRTRTIARKYSAIILDNPKKLPEYAKAIGFQKAKGEYVIEMDSDEELLSANQLQKRKDFLVQHREIKALMANTILPAPKCGIASSYINYCGDPFSFFIYDIKKTKIETFKKFADTFEEGGMVFKFYHHDLIPIADGGTLTLSLSYIKQNFSKDWDTVAFACTAFDRVVNKTMCCGCIKSDSIRHYSNGTFKVYLSKLRFRVINNLFYKGESGFSAREHKKILFERKIIFVLYSASVIWPLFDSIRLAIIYRDWRFLLHIVYLYYVYACIFYYSLRYLFGKNVANESYGDIGNHEKANKK